MFTAPQLRVGEDDRSVTGDKGYSMIRATHGRSEVDKSAHILSILSN